MTASAAEQQARNELANARAYGNRDQEAAARKRLTALGVELEDAGNARRSAAEDTGDEDKARKAPPQGRATPAKAQTRA